jgi:hypothetical protein
MSDVGVLGRVNLAASVSPLFLDICSTRPEVATHGEVLHWEDRKHRTMFSPTYTVRLIVSPLARIIPTPVRELV